MSTENEDPLAEPTRMANVIADKIADGTLFDAGIYSRADLARLVRVAVCGWRMRAELFRDAFEKATARPDTSTMGKEPR